MPRDYPFDAACAVFIVSNAAALCDAAILLGGAAAEKRVRHLIDEIGLVAPITGRLNRELDMLEDLLALRHVDNTERDEAGYFAMIDPASPVVEEICILLDGLRDARNAEPRFAA